MKNEMKWKFGLTVHQLVITQKTPISITASSYFLNLFAHISFIIWTAQPQYQLFCRFLLQKLKIE